MHSLLVLDLERLGVRAEVDLLRDARAGRVAHLERDLLRRLLALAVLASLALGRLVLAALGLPDEALNPARDLLLALAGEQRLLERVAPRGVLLLQRCQLPLEKTQRSCASMRQSDSLAETHLQQGDATAALLRHADERLDARDVVVHDGPVHGGAAGLVRRGQQLRRRRLEQGVQDV